MKTTRLFTLQKLLLMLLTLVHGLVSCTEETLVSGSEVVNKKGETTFRIKVPASPTILTRSINQGETNDKAVKTIDLLLFDPIDKKYVGKVLSDKIIDISDTEKTFTVFIPKGKYDIMILANARSIVYAAITPDYDPLSRYKSEIHNRLISTLPSKEEAPLTGIWNAQPSSLGYKDFPMWSEKQNFDVVESGASLSITLVRMLAKVNVRFKTKEASKKLTIESIMVCNFNQSGYLASDKWDLSTKDEDAQLPENVDENASRSLGVSNGVVYANTTAYPTIIREEEEIQLCKDEIFLFESQKPTDNTSEEEKLKATCLIIKGKYDGGSDDRYYRIDFSSREGSTINYLNILRNHIYDIVITGVNTAGHPTPEIAYQSFPTDLNIGISSWNDGGMGEIVFDGQYMLSITPSELELYKEASTANSFLIHTDYLSVPTIQPVADYIDPDNADWITSISKAIPKPHLDKENGKKKAYEVTFDGLENVTRNSRLAKINVTVGNHLNIKVSVTQSATPILALQVDELTGDQQKDLSELIFPSGLYASNPVVSKSIRLSWVPFANNNSCESAAANIGSDFNFGAGTALPIGPLTSSTGAFEYDILPPAFELAEVAPPNEFLEKTRLYTYSTTNGVKKINKTLLLHQVHYNAVATVAKYYLMNGGNYSFKVRSNSKWRITVGRKDGKSGDPEGVVTSLTSTQGGYDTQNGQVVKFSLANDIANGGVIGQSDVTFLITCTDPLRYFDPIEVPINAIAGEIRELSNSFMVLPGSGPILIPVKRANGVLLDGSDTAESNWFYGPRITADGDSAKFGVKLLWADNSTGLTADGVIQEIKTIGSGNTGYLFVTPGSLEGNAVVALTRTPGTGGGEGTGEILWSFHIWVTTYKPYNEITGEAQGSGTGNYWMDRNLGALSNEAGIESYGLFYQFGRKDPFPRPKALNSIGSNGGKPRYDSSGKQIDHTYFSSGATAIESVRAPMKAAYPWYGSLESTGNSESDTPWNNHNKKTIYDPCPKGYRVPQYSTNPLDHPHSFGSENTNSGNGDSTPMEGNGGIIWAEKGGFYPAAGYLIYSGAYSGTGVNGYAWTATPIPGSLPYGYCVWFTGAAMTPYNPSLKTAVGSVRCVAEWP